MTMVLENPPESLLDTQSDQLDTIEGRLNNLITIAQQVAVGLTQARDGGFDIDLSSIFLTE